MNDKGNSFDRDANAEEQVGDMAIAGSNRTLLKHSLLLGGAIGVFATCPVAKAGGLVALYDFEDNVLDSSGNANNGTANGTGIGYSTSVPAAINSRSNKSISLSGDAGSDFVSLPANFNAAAQEPGGASLSLWVQTAAAVDQDYVFSMANDSNNTQFYGIQGNPSDTNSMRVYARNNTGSGSDVSATGTANVFGTGWNHLVLTNDGSSLRVYVNGSNIADITLTLNGGAGAYTMDTQTIGAINRSGDFGYLAGQIDEVAVFDRVLTTAEIAQLAGGLDPTTIPDVEPPTPTPLDFRVSSDATDLTFTWNSETEKFYNLKTSMNLSASVSTWHLLEKGIAADLPLNTETMTRPDDPYRFYVLEDTTNTTFGLWSGATIPSNHTLIPFPDGLETYTLLDAADPYPYKFLHGAAIINYNGTFHANWANSPLNENFPDEALVGRTFTDESDTNTWSVPEVIGSDLPGLDRRSHASYLEHNGELWTFVARFGTGDPGVRFDGLRAEGFKLNNTTGNWESQGIVMTNCWPYEEPVLMSNGNYIVAGQDKDGKPVCAISHGSDLTQWDTVLIPYPPAMTFSFGETTVWAEGTEVTAVIRNRTGVAWVATSIDGGRTWAEARRSNMPMPAAKAYLGKLSTGQMYMVSNLTNRNTMIVSVGKPGETTLSSMWRIRFGSSSPIPLFSGAAKSPQWSYPYGYEHDGKLYIVYSIGKENCGLSVVPISSLATAP